ncbi:hypothetical protein PT974_05587 [Cladobotryum mycophilum]|uniref:Uncharacterized protein n=1 Tax=Cladobotryum mycophilum TaxID=491253 RepID=A0ABR0SJ41_9HYPO
MDTGGLLAQMTSNNFVSPVGHGMPGGLAARRGGQNIKPLSFDAIKQGNASQDGGVPTPRTSRSHLLAGLRTAPKTASAASFGPMSPTASDSPVHHYARNSINGNAYGYGQNNAYNPPKTAYPQYGQQSGYHTMMNHHHQQYTLAMDEQTQEQMDPNFYAQLVATNAYLAQQQQRLQQQLMSVQAAAQKFQQYNINTPQQLAQQQQLALLEQQQLQVQQAQQAQLAQAAMAQGQQVYYNPLTGQYYVDTSAVSQMNSVYSEPPMTPGFNGFQQQQQQQQHQHHHQQQQQQQQGTPRVQVSPPPETQQVFRSDSPPKRFDSPSEVTPLPPPSANAFRRHKKSASSLAPLNSALAAVTINDSAKSPAPKTASFPLTPALGGYGPGQARAGEHPVRQPRGPPNWDELKDKPTAKFEGSKNFVTRTRRSAVHNLVRAHMERRKGSGSSSGSMTPVSEAGDDSVSPITDNDSDSGRSGSGSLAGEEESISSRTSASGSWGAIGSDRPSSRQKARNSVDSTASGSEPADSSFADVFKNGALRATKAQESASGQRKAARLVLTSAEKRKTATGA